MTSESRGLAELGGVSILSLLINHPRYMANNLRQDLWRAGHAHAGVLLILSLAARYRLPRFSCQSHSSFRCFPRMLRSPTAQFISPVWAHCPRDWSHYVGRGFDPSP
jgi:hypothetical protein